MLRSALNIFCVTANQSGRVSIRHKTEKATDTINPPALPSGKPPIGLACHDKSSLFFDDLTPDAKWHVMDHLDLRDMAALAATNRANRDLISEDSPRVRLYKAAVREKRCDHNFSIIKKGVSLLKEGKKQEGMTILNRKLDDFTLEQKDEVFKALMSWSCLEVLL